MPVNIVPALSKTTPALGIEMSWQDSQCVMIVTEKGMVACGVIDTEVMDRMGAAIAIARGTKEKPLVTTPDLLSASIEEMTGKAAEHGVTVGMTGAEALAMLSD
ncbi:MAG: DUF1805 domain-containing protein [Candidatus Hydrogenedentota bacterium]